MFGSAILVAMVTLTAGRDELCYMHHGWALQTTQLSEVLAELNLYHIAKVTEFAKLDQTLNYTIRWAPWNTSIL